MCQAILSKTCFQASFNCILRFTRGLILPLIFISPLIAFYCITWKTMGGTFWGLSPYIVQPSWSLISCFQHNSHYYSVHILYICHLVILVIWVARLSPVQLQQFPAVNQRYMIIGLIRWLIMFVYVYVFCPCK